MKTVLTKLTVGIIFLGTLGYGLNRIFGQDIITYMSVVSQNGLTYYKYDFYSYLRTIADTLETLPDLKLNIPQRQWVVGTDILSVLMAINNNLLVILDWFLFTINITLYPLRIAFYAIKLILTVIGLDMVNIDPNSAIYWLQILCETMIRLEIPYI